MGDTRRVLYRLPEIIQAVAAEKIVFVVEGEKAADALARVGVSATCSPGGAGKWRKEYSTYLAGADVVILPDANSPGEQHCEAVAASLTGIAARVRVSFYACRGSRRKATSMIGSPKAETLNSFGIWSKAQRLTGDAPMPQKAAPRRRVREQYPHWSSGEGRKGATRVDPGRSGCRQRLVEEAMNKLGVVFFIVPTIGVRLKGHSEFGM